MGVYVILLAKLAPKVKDFRSNIKIIYRESRLVGFPVYIGALLNVGSAQLLILMLGVYVGVEAVGHYSLAFMIDLCDQMI